MHSEAGYRQTEGAKHKSLGEEITITYKAAVDIPDRRFQCVLDVMYAVRLMTNSWAMAGAHKVESKTEWDSASSCYKQVREVHLTQSIGYYDFVFEKAWEHPGPERATVRWLLDRDRRTRAKARSMFAQGFPYGEALQQCRDTQCLVLWQVSSNGLVKQPVPVVADDDGGEDVDMDLDDKPKKPRRKRLPRSVRKRNAADKQSQQQNQQRAQGGQPNQRRPWGQQQQQQQRKRPQQRNF